MAELRYQFVASEEGRLVVGRLLPGTDLVPGILAVCREHGIRSAFVVSMIGSLSRMRYVYVARKPSTPMGIGYGDPVELSAPVELLSCQGTIGVWEDGRADLHLHFIAIDTEGVLRGGHMLGEGNPTLATVEFAIRESREASIVRREDEETGFPLFGFTEA
jgi:hypothetical protein